MICPCCCCDIDTVYVILVFETGVFKSSTLSIIPENIPQFNLFDPFDDKALDKISLNYPFWIKPIKSFRSFLAFQINSDREFQDCVAIIRNQIETISEPFNDLLEYLDLPQEIASISGQYCLAEQMISGQQCTLEGYVFRGEVHIYGVIAASILKIGIVKFHGNGSNYLVFSTIHSYCDRLQLPKEKCD